MVRQSSTGSRHSNVVRSHERANIAAWTPEFNGTQIRFCDPSNPSNCTAWVELKGDPGSGGEPIEGDSGEGINQGQLVYKKSDSKFYLASSAAPETREIVGLADTSVIEGEPLNVIGSGLFTLGSWSWTVGAPVLAGLNGNLTQTPPTDGYIAMIGHAVNSDTILINIEPSVLLVASSSEAFRPVGISPSGELRAESGVYRVFIQESEPPDVAGWWVKTDESGAAVDLLYNPGA